MCGKSRENCTKRGLPSAKRERRPLSPIGHRATFQRPGISDQWDRFVQETGLMNGSFFFFVEHSMRSVIRAPMLIDFIKGSGARCKWPRLLAGYGSLVSCLPVALCNAGCDVSFADATNGEGRWTRSAVFKPGGES